MAIYFDCPACGDVHRGRLVVADRVTFCSLSLDRHQERCPLTREEVELSHWDMFWRDEAEKSEGIPWRLRAPSVPLLTVEERRRASSGFGLLRLKR
jgi:hypothetical protein